MMTLALICLSIGAVCKIVLIIHYLRKNGGGK